MRSTIEYRTGKGGDVKQILLLIVVTAALYGTVSAEPAISIPYEDFKKLYEESVRKEVMDSVEKEPFRYSFDKAHYTMSISGDGARCQAVISGTLISGKPEPVPLFEKEVIIRKVIEVKGGSLLFAGTGKKRLAFLPADKGGFQISLTFYIPSEEDNRSGFITAMIPDAITNALSPSATGAITLTEVPGVKTGDGSYYFSRRNKMTIRFADTKSVEKAAKADDLLSKEYRAVRTPATVLESVYCYTSFEESGNSLSVLVLKIPPEAGERFRIKSIPDASIWRCTVNGKRVRVYTTGEKDPWWVLPLEKGTVATVKLSFLRKGEKLGLHGKLEAVLPEIDFPAGQVNLAIGLPERVELVSYEGPLAPSGSFKARAPKEFIGSPSYFSRAFYKGEGLKLAVSYREPVTQ